LTTVTGPLIARDNPELLSLNLSTLASVGTTVSAGSYGVLVQRNPKLTQFDLSGLTTQRRQFQLENFAGSSLGSWPNLTALGEMHFENNPNLLALPAAPNLTTGASVIVAQDNPLLVDLGFEALTSLTGCPDDDDDIACCSLTVRGNPSLSDLSVGASGLVLAGVCVTLMPITNLAGFPRPTNTLILAANPNLTSLSGGPVVGHLMYVGIVNNAMLPTCAADAYRVATTATNYDIYGNNDAGTCN
jgi:hypothetical protein